MAEPRDRFPRHSAFLAFGFALEATALGLIAPPFKMMCGVSDVPMPGLTLAYLVVADIFVTAWPIWLAVAACVVLASRRSQRWTHALTAASMCVLMLTVCALLAPYLSLYQGIGRQK